MRAKMLRRSPLSCLAGDASVASFLILKRKKKESIASFLGTFPVIVVELQDEDVTQQTVNFARRCLVPSSIEVFSY